MNQNILLVYRGQVTFSNFYVYRLSQERQIYHAYQRTTHVHNFYDAPIWLILIIWYTSTINSRILNDPIIKIVYLICLNGILSENLKDGGLISSVLSMMGSIERCHREDQRVWNWCRMKTKWNFG